jgi:hypothetical protein
MSTVNSKKKKNKNKKKKTADSPYTLMSMTGGGDDQSFFIYKGNSTTLTQVNETRSGQWTCECKEAECEHIKWVKQWKEDNKGTEKVKPLWD